MEKKASIEMDTVIEAVLAAGLREENGYIYSDHAIVGWSGGNLYSHPISYTVYGRGRKAGGVKIHNTVTPDYQNVYVSVEDASSSEKVLCKTFSEMVAAIERFIPLENVTDDPNELPF